MLKIFNTLGREQQVFTPLEEGKARVYTCGPTVYDFVTIGNWRTYTLGDFVVRTLKYLEYEVAYVMNITDVGHLTGDNLGDADTGVDRLEKAAHRENKTAWDVAEYYTDNFKSGFNKMNLTMPMLFSKATDHISEQINLVKELESKGLAYKIEDGIYFDTKRYEEMGYKYGEISNLDEIKEGARVEINPDKRNPRDFALWKFSSKEEKRDMEWESPWGLGFPGWHIECSAMAMKYLGDQLDIHLGGDDLKSTHHPNEIAQSQGATGIAPFVNYWMHGAFLQVDGGRMGKSLGNAYTVEDLEAKGYSMSDLRYLYLTAHYRKQLNFTFDGLDGAKTALDRLKGAVNSLAEKVENLHSIKSMIDPESKSHFIRALEEDFNLPQALAVAWDMIKSDLSAEVKLATILDFDRVLGLKLEEELEQPNQIEIPTEAKIILEERNIARIQKDYKKADELRDQLKDEFGLIVKDTDKGQFITN